MKHLHLNGRGIDLGAKSKKAKYYDYIDPSNVSEMDFVDYFHAGDGVIKMDLEQPFPIQDDTYDFVFSFNVMEHIYNYYNFTSESMRILKAGGVIHGIVPMMWHFHPDPNDYFRFTEQALRKLLNDVGMEAVVVRPLACGPFKVAASQIGYAIKLRVLILPLYITGIVMDSLFALVCKGSHKYALGYYYSGIKPGANG